MPSSTRSARSTNCSAVSPCAARPVAGSAASSSVSDNMHVGVGRDQRGADRNGDQLGLRPYFQALLEALDVKTNGRLRDVQPTADLVVGEAVRSEFQDTLLLGRERPFRQVLGAGLVQPLDDRRG